MQSISFPNSWKRFQTGLTTIFLRWINIWKWPMVTQRWKAGYWHRLMKDQVSRRAEVGFPWHMKINDGPTLINSQIPTVKEKGQHLSVAQCQFSYTGWTSENDQWSHVNKQSDSDVGRWDTFVGWCWLSFDGWTSENDWWSNVDKRSDLHIDGLDMLVFLRWIDVWKWLMVPHW